MTQFHYSCSTRSTRTSSACTNLTAQDMTSRLSSRLISFEINLRPAIDSYARVRVRPLVLSRSAARLRLCDVTFYCFEINAHDSADEAATAIVNVHLRN